LRCRKFRCYELDCRGDGQPHAPQVWHDADGLSERQQELACENSRELDGAGGPDERK
jgi:hypothetical protein